MSFRVAELFRLAVIVGWALLVFQAGGRQARAADLVHLSGSTMGTTYNVKFHSDATKIDPENLSAKIDARLQAINLCMSTYIGDSEVCRFNRAPAGEWFEVSSDTSRVVELAQSVSFRMNGAFDITVAPLVRLWNFGAGQNLASQFKPPTAEQIASALESTGYDKLSVRLDPPALKKLIDTLEIDLSGIAKGFAVDELATLLHDHRIDDYMVEIGGEVRVAGSRPDGNRWGIGIEAPRKSSRELKSVIEVENAGIASSGDYRNFHEHEGKSYSHTINPRVGSPVGHQLAAVSVVADTCAEADAVATGLLVMGPKDGYQWAEENQVASLFLTREDNQVVESTTSSFDIAVNGPPVRNGKSDFARLALASAIIFGIALIGMAVGVIFSNRQLKGSCGGLANIKDEAGITACDLCRHPSPDCTGENKSKHEVANHD